MDGIKDCKFLMTMVWMVAVCGAIPIPDLLARASQHSDKMHYLSKLLDQELDTHLSPNDRLSQPHDVTCHTSALGGPTNKDQAFQVSDHSLMSLTRSILQSWRDPLVQMSVHANTLRHPVQGSIASKIQELQEHSKGLGAGLDNLSTKMGPAAQVVSISPYQGTGNFGQDTISKLINFQYLLSCLSRDYHKIDSFLKVLRCRSSQMRAEMC